MDPSSARGAARRALRSVRFALLARRAAVGVWGALVFASPFAQAGEFTQEINQVCAVNGGCFAGDSAGFPVTIVSGGHYRLTSNLTIPNEDTRGIFVDASNVDLDLGGFVVSGPVVCSGAPLVCSPSGGTGAGVESNFTRVDVHVRNGTIRGAGADGLSLGTRSVVKNVRVHSSGDDGILVGQESVLDAFAAYGNGGDGVVGAEARGVVVSDCLVARNGGIGVHIAESGDPFPGIVVSGCAIYQNASTGIFGGNVGTVTSNAVYDNGSGVVLNHGGNVVSSNAIVSNTNTGLLAGTSSLTDNTITNNGLNIGAGTSSSLLGGNSCNGTATCP